MQVLVRSQNIMRYLRAVALASLVGLVTITLYLIVSRFVIGHVPLNLGLEQLLQWDASNAYGDAAYSGGWNMAGIGMAMNVVVTLIWASLFVYAYANFEIVRRRPLLLGFLLGVAVMIVMTYAVVPLGHARQPSTALAVVANIAIAHTLFFGVPVMWVVRATA